MSDLIGSRGADPGAALAAMSGAVSGAAGTAALLVGVALLVVLAVAVAVVAVRLARLSAPARSAGWTLLRARLALGRARSARSAAVRRAELGVRRAERRHSSAIAALDRRIVGLEDPRGPSIATFGPVALHELRIVTPAGEVPLDGVEATVDSAGELTERKRATLTRMAVGGLVLGPLGAVLALGFQKRRTVDDRELYLLVEAGPASCVLQVKPDTGAAVRAFAVRINAAASGVDRARSRVAAELTAARAALAATREDVSELESARARLAAARSDARLLAAVGAAEAELTAARARWVDERWADAGSA
jgi:hypothetical protein